MSKIINRKEYLDWIFQLKEKIQSSQLKAITSVNRELLSLYWELGKSISLKINQSKWGASIAEKLSKDLKKEFPNQKGFSRSNLFSMKKWFEFYNNSTLTTEKVQQLVGQIPQPIGIAAYELNKSIPVNLQSKLPSIQQIEEELLETIKSSEK